MQVKDDVFNREDQNNAREDLIPHPQFDIATRTQNRMKTLNPRTLKGLYVNFLEHSQH